MDLNLKVVNGRFEHGFFEKPCTSETVIPYTSAHSRKMKMSVLVEEGVRRLRNHSRELEWERSRQVMEDWSRKLRKSGYPATMRREEEGKGVEEVKLAPEQGKAGVCPSHLGPNSRRYDEGHEGSLQRL